MLIPNLGTHILHHVIVLYMDYLESDVFILPYLFFSVFIVSVIHNVT
jgi:hypothetical protein